MFVKLELNSSEIVINYICLPVLVLKVKEENQTKINNKALGFKLCHMLKISHTGLKILPLIY